MLRISKPHNDVCKACQFGKKTRFLFKTKEYSMSRPLKIIHIDHFEPSRTCALKGERYFMLFVDDFTRMTWVSFLKEKSEAFEKFKNFKALDENKRGFED